MAKNPRMTEGGGGGAGQNEIASGARGCQEGNAQLPVSVALTTVKTPCRPLMVIRIQIDSSEKLKGIRNVY